MKYVEAVKAIRIKTLIFDVKYKDQSDGQKDAFHDRNARPLGPLRLKATDSETHNSQDEDNDISPFAQLTVDAQLHSTNRGEEERM
jgi:hypothetical protein